MTVTAPLRAGRASASCRVCLRGVPAVLALAVCGVAACSSNPAQLPSHSASEFTSPPSQFEEQQEGDVDLEREVIDALEAFPYGRSTVHDSGEDQVVVTIWTDGEEIAASELAAIKRAVEGAAGATEVVVEVSAEAPPVAN